MDIPFIPHRAQLPPGLDPRSASVLREIVDQYVETGEPVGSRTLSRRLPVPLSPATIRNVMADLTEAGLLFSPHTSAGRLPTERGLRLFVDGLLQCGELGDEERDTIGQSAGGTGPQPAGPRWRDVSSMLSGLSAAAGLVVAPKTDGAVRHIEFVPLGPGRALVILVSEDGQVENRVIETPPGTAAVVAGARRQLPERAADGPVADGVAGRGIDRDGGGPVAAGRVVGAGGVGGAGNLDRQCRGAAGVAA